jgi:hypothetical protein
MRPEVLIAIGEQLGEEDMRRLEQHSMRCLNGAYPAWFHRCLGAVTTVPLYKTQERENTQIRPLGVASSFVRCIERIGARQNCQIVLSYLEPQQQVLSVAGAHRLVHMTRMALEENEEWVGVKLDVENAHSSIYRAAIIEVLEQEPDLQHMAWSCATSVAAPTALEVGGKVWGEAGDGVCQGKPSSGGYYATGWHPEVRVLDEDVAEEGGAARFFSDDGYVFGPPATVFSAYLKFEAAIRLRCGLHIQREKTGVYYRGESRLLHPQHLDGIWIGQDQYRMPLASLS